MRKLILTFISFILLICMVGCNKKDLNSNLVIDSYASSKIDPATVFQLKIKNSFEIDDDYIFELNYGHNYQIDETIDQDDINIVGKFRIIRIDNKNSVDFTNLQSVKPLLEVQNFYTSKYKVDITMLEDGNSVIDYNNSLSFTIPKDLIVDNKGILFFSFISQQMDENNELHDSNYEGSNIYIKYYITDNIIHFENF